MTTPSPLSPVVGEAQASPVERFRKRPIEVEMMLWDGTPERAEEIKEWVGESPRGLSTFLTPAEVSAELGRPDPEARLWVAHSTAYIPMAVGERVAKEADGNGFYPISAAAIAGTFDPAPEPLELTPPEQAAVAKSPHMSTCHEPVCVDCAKELRQLRRYIVAIWPVIEEEATRPLKERLEAAEDEYRLLADQIGHLASDGWDDDAAEVDILIRFVKHLATFHPDCPGRFCDDAPPAAAALDPTPIPDGEE